MEKILTALMFLGMNAQTALSAPGSVLVYEDDGPLSIPTMTGSMFLFLLCAVFTWYVCYQNYGRDNGTFYVILLVEFIVYGAIMKML